MSQYIYTRILPPTIYQLQKDMNVLTVIFVEFDLFKDDKPTQNTMYAYRPKKSLLTLQDRFYLQPKSLLGSQ